MNHLSTEGIILTRIDYGEADRILTLLTPDHGKLRVIAKGVRRVKSKLAGGIELFSVSQLTFIKGRGDIGTLTSTRLIRHYDGIVRDLDRTMLGYELIKKLDKTTEEGVEQGFFDLLQQTLMALNDQKMPLNIVRLWFAVRMLDLTGRSLELQVDDRGERLRARGQFTFNPERMAFRQSNTGPYTSDHIKILRLARTYSPLVLAQVYGSDTLIENALRLLDQH
ncbi:MAG TPA: DNA repair protein RecO [Candidatus Saccharimonadales bacterium]|nr:DNA repair protein RecO [Candidatus Saccharimonadales bacterium]